MFTIFKRILLFSIAIYRVLRQIINIITIHQCSYIVRVMGLPTLLFCCSHWYFCIRHKGIFSGGTIQGKHTQIQLKRREREIYMVKYMSPCMYGVEPNQIDPMPLYKEVVLLRIGLIKQHRGGLTIYRVV